LVRNEWALCGLLAVLALLLRSVQLDSALWLDEINGVLEWMRPPLFEILTVYKGDGQHPLYALLGHASIVLFGEHPWSVRLPAALFGALSVPLLYVLGRAAGTRREALFAALLLMVSYHHVWFSQNARGYTILTFFVLLGTYCLLRGLAEGGNRWFIGYGIAIALGAYTHITVLFPAFAHALVAFWAVWRKRERARGSEAGATGAHVRAVAAGAHLRAVAAGGTGSVPQPAWRGPVLGFGLAAALTVVLYAPILKQVIWWFLFRPSNFEGVSTPSWAFVEALRVMQRGVVGGTSAVVGALAIAAGGTILLAGMVSYYRQSRVAFVLFTVPFVTTFAGALLARGTMYPRFFFFLLPYAILMVVRGLEVTGLWLGQHLAGFSPGLARGRAIGTALCVVAIAAFALSLGAVYRYPKQDFVGAMEYVEAHRSPGETVLIVGAARRPIQDYHERPWPVVASPAAIDSLAGPAGYWLVYTFPRYIEHETPALMRRIRETCDEREVFRGTVGGGDIIVCRVTKEPHRS
jgi:4-amino-4-deoxy-L-arabinose transferase-like glycosyltransferase